MGTRSAFLGAADMAHLELIAKATQTEHEARTARLMRREHVRRGPARRIFSACTTLHPFKRSQVPFRRYYRFSSHGVGEKTPQRRHSAVEGVQPWRLFWRHRLCMAVRI